MEVIVASRAVVAAAVDVPQEAVGAVEAVAVTDVARIHKDKGPRPTLLIKPTTFQEILKIWESELWEGRKSPIEPASAINENGEIDMALLQSPSFFWQAVKPNGEILGVISGQQGPGWMRSRGLWVNARFRRQGVGQQLIAKVIEYALDAKLRKIWTMARSTSLSFYSELGFRITRQIDGYEFGPHHLAEFYLIDSSTQSPK